MAITTGIAHLSGQQSHSASYALASEDISPGNFLIEGVIDDAEPRSIPIASESPPKKRRQTQKRALRESEWEEQRYWITTSYRTMTLGKLMKEMERRGFYASIPAYKKHLEKWGLNNKNFKASEKQAAIDLLNNPLMESDSTTARSIPLHRLKRYEKDLRRREREALKKKSRHSSKLDVDQTSYSSSPQSFHNAVYMKRNIGNQYVNIVAMNERFLYSPSERTAELFFMRLREYVQVRLRALTSRSSSSMCEVGASTLYRIPLSQDNLCDHLGMAINAFSAGEMLITFEWLDRAGAFAKDFFQQAHWRLLVLLRYIRKLYNRDAEVGRSIARFFADMAMVFYPNPEHCIVQLFRLFLQIDQQNSVLEAAGQIALDSVRRVARDDGTVLALMHVDLVNLYCSSNLYDSAVRMAQRSIKFCSRTFGPKHYQTRGAMHSLAVTHYDNGKFVDARQALKTLLQVYDDESVQNDDFYLAVCLLLGDSCLRLGMLSDATHAYSLPLPMYSWQANDENRCITLEIREALEYCKRMTHNIERRRLRFLSPDDLPDNIVNPGSVACKHADMLFEECCKRFGW